MFYLLITTEPIRGFLPDDEINCPQIPINVTQSTQNIDDNY